MATKTHAKNLDQTGRSAFVVEHEVVETKGNVSGTLADAGVFDAGPASTGVVTVEETVNGNSGTFDVINTAGTLSTVKRNGPVLFTHTKDTAASINVYVENGNLQVQNLTGADINVTVKSYV
jgi:hypothetical protein